MRPRCERIARIAAGALCLFARPPQLSQADSWHVENVDLLPRTIPFLNSAIALDQHGNPHLSYVRDGAVVHAYKSEGSWTTEVIDSVHTPTFSDGARTSWLGSTPNTAIAAFGDDIHIAYLSSSPSVRHAAKSKGSWSIVTVDTTVSSSTERLALALDSQGNPFISFCGYPSCTDGKCSLKYASKSSGVWQTEFIDSTRTGSGRITGPHSALFLTGDALHIVGMVSRSWQGSVRYARRNVDWFVETITDRGGQDVSLALDSRGTPHVAWLTVTGVRHAQRSGDGEWLFEDFVDSVDPLWGTISIGLDAKDTVHILYSTDDALKYLIRNTGNTWGVETVENETWSLVRQFSTSLVLDGHGRAHICYVGTNGPFDEKHLMILKYAFRAP